MTMNSAEVPETTQIQLELGPIKRVDLPAG
jgi:hypothetical protein